MSRKTTSPCSRWCGPLAPIPAGRHDLGRPSHAVAGLGLSPGRLDKLKTAVAEATMNAIEHGNDSRAELPVRVEVFQSGTEVIVTVTDLGGRSHDGVPE